MKDHHILLLALEAAVPLNCFELRNHPKDKLVQIAKEAGLELASKGDVLQYGSKKKGETAYVFNHVARGIAAMLILCPPHRLTFKGVEFSVPWSVENVEAP
jgi:hypothetical protein